MLEKWEDNAKMRHIPSLDWMVGKVDTDLRRTINKVFDPFLLLKSDDPRRPRFELELRNLCRTLDHLAEVAKHGRHNGQQGDIVHRVEAALNHAVANLRSLDGNLIGRRFPFHTFERSKAEPLYGALLAVLQVVERLVPLADDLALVYAPRVARMARAAAVEIATRDFVTVARLRGEGAWSVGVLSRPAGAPASPPPAACRRYARFFPGA